MKFFILLYSLIPLSLIAGVNEEQIGRSVSSIYHEEKLWDNGSTLNILFMNGSNQDKEKIKKISIEWTKYANIDFKFFNHDELSYKKADIKIKIKADCNGNNTKLGKDSRLVKNNEHSMCLINLDPYVILHEFGHALGLKHEHLHPDFHERLSPHYISECMRVNKWDLNYCKRAYEISEKGITILNYDKYSIMQYRFIKQKSLLNKEFQDEFLGSPGILSLEDRVVISNLYPNKPNFVDPENAYESDINKMMNHSLCKIVDSRKNSESSDIVRDKCGDDGRFGFFIVNDQSMSIKEQASKLRIQCYENIQPAIKLFVDLNMCQVDE